MTGYSSRITPIRGYLKHSGLSAFLVLTKINRQYVSSFTGSAGVMVIWNLSLFPSPGEGRVPKEGGVALYVDDRYTIRAKRESLFKVHSLEKLSTSPALRAPSPGLGRGGRGRTVVAVEDKITLRELKWLKKTLRGVRFVPTKDVLENLRAIKTNEEIRYIKKAQTIIDKIFSAAKKLAIVGLTENQLAQKMESMALKLGADGMAFDSIVAFGANAAAPHHLSGSRKIRKGNFLLLDFGVLVNGYHSDFTRTLFIGRPNKKQEKVYNTVLEAQIRGIGEIREGIKASQIDNVARRFIGKAGFGKYFTHNTGHGVGLEIHELPNFAPKSEDVLAKDMIVTVEPGIYIEGWGGVRIEDMVLVGEKGPIVLSKSPKDFKSMIVKS